MTGSFHQRIAGRLATERETLIARWLKRVREFVAVAPDKILPTPELLDQMPDLLGEIAHQLKHAPGNTLATSMSSDRARAIGELRFRQNASVHQILREYDLLIEVVEEVVCEEAERCGPDLCEATDVIRRLGRTVRFFGHTTVDTFVSRYAKTVAEQQKRLEDYGRMLGHELRNPLNALKLSVEALATSPEGELDGAVRDRLVGAVRRNIERARRVMDEAEKLRELGESRSIEMPSVQEVDVAAVARDVVRQLQPLIESKDVQIEMDSDLPRIVTDAGRLETILLNLVSNAIKYSGPSKARRWVKISSAGGALEGQVCVSVVDNGIGIPEAEQGKIFRRFYRAHEKRDAELENVGSGLGLAITKSLVEELGGTLTVKSTEGEGSTFTIALPREP